MKKLIIAAAFILLAGVAFGQTLQKGSVLAIRVTTITLDPDVTMNQYLDIWINKWASALEKNMPGAKAFMLKGDRGAHENGYAWIWYFESLEVRDKYFTAEGNTTELGTSAMDKMAPIGEELSKLGTSSAEYTDWVIL